MKKSLLNILSLLAAAALLLSACAPAATPTAAPQPTAASGMDALIAAAKAEGTLTTIALPHDWCNYGEVIEGFKAKSNSTPTPAPSSRS